MKLKSKNELYCLVDENYISEFDSSHQAFMKKIYYKSYSKFAKAIGSRRLSKSDFFKNMHRRRIKLYQLCCPYCGAIEIIPEDRNWKNSGGLNYCCNCGRNSTINVCFEHLARFVRLSQIVDDGLSAKKKKYRDVEEWLIGYEAYQMELIALVSILEVVFRDYFEALLFINNLNNGSNEYIQKCIDKYMGNEFMLIEKTNEHYKKAFNIDIKRFVDADVWNDLIDIVNLRNIFVHNNGYIDERFRKSKSYDRLKSNVHGELYCLKKENTMKYFKSVATATLAITDCYYNEYYRLRRKAVANYYFNDFNGA
jgi:hypothetical protein